MGNDTKRALTLLGFFVGIITVLFITMDSMLDWHSYGFSTFWVVWVMVMAVVAYRFRSVFTE